MKQRRTHKAGFTILEVLLAMVLLAIGLVAMMAMQVTFIQGTTQAQDLSVGTFLGERTVEGMRGEATNWSVLQPDLGGAITNAGGSATTSNLLRLTGNEGSWTSLYGGFPVNNEGLPNAPGLPTNGDSAPDLNARYCVDGVLNYASPTRDVLSGQIRVAWATSGKAPWLSDPPSSCGNSLADVVYVGGVPAPGYNVVYVPFTIRRKSL